MTGRIAGRPLILTSGILTRGGRLLVSVDMAVMTAVLTAFTVYIGLRAFDGVVMRPLGMAAAITMVVQRRRDRIGEQVTRQNDADCDFPKNRHYQDLNRQTFTDLHNPTSLRTLPLECNHFIAFDRHVFDIIDQRPPECAVVTGNDTRPGSDPGWLSSRQRRRFVLEGERFVAMQAAVVLRQQAANTFDR